jgi:hypothetical protein
LQPKSRAGQEKGEERIGNTVEPFDAPGRDFRRNPKGHGTFDPSFPADRGAPVNLRPAG